MNISIKGTLAIFLQLLYFCCQDVEAQSEDCNSTIFEADYTKCVMNSKIAYEEQVKMMLLDGLTFEDSDWCQIWDDAVSKVGKSKGYSPSVYIELSPIIKIPH